MKKSRIVFYAIIALTYLALVGVALHYSLILGVLTLAAPFVFLAYMRFRRGFGSPLKIPILRLHRAYTASFYTDAPEIEVRYVIGLGDDLGVKTKAILSKLPNTDLQAYRLIVYSEKLTEKRAKQNLASALQSMVSMLSLKGYKIIPASDVDESLLELESESVQKISFPVLTVFSEEDYGFAVSETVELVGNCAVLVTESTHLAKCAAYLMRQMQSDIKLVRFAQNFGFTAFDQNMEAGFVADVAQVCFGLSNEATLLLASVLVKARKEGHPLNPYTIGEMLEAETHSHNVGSKVHDELLAFQEAIKADTVWRGLVKDHSPAGSRTLVVDLSHAGTSKTTSFVTYLLAERFVRKGWKVVLDLTRFEEAAITHAINDVRLAQSTAFLLPKTRVKREHYGSFGTLIYLGADQFLKGLLKDVAIDKDAIQENASYIVTKTRSVTPIIKKSLVALSESDVEDLIAKSSPPLEVEDVSEKPYLPSMFEDKVVEAITAALGYVEKYSIVEETTFEQALGLKSRSSEVCSKLVRLGYLKRRKKGGINFVELTARGHEELEKLRHAATQKNTHHTGDSP